MDFINSSAPASFQYIPWWRLLNVLLEKRNFPEKLYTKSAPISVFGTLSVETSSARPVMVIRK